MSEIILIANGDLRLSANRVCWDAQKQTEEAVMNAIRREGHSVRARASLRPRKGPRIHRQPELRHEGLPQNSPRRAARRGGSRLAILPSRSRTDSSPIEGPILTVANWSGQWPGLVGMLNLNGSLTKAGVQYSTLWSDDFTDDILPRWTAALARRASGSATTTAMSSA